MSEAEKNEQIEAFCSDDCKVRIDFKSHLHPCTIEAYHPAGSSTSQNKSTFLCGQYELDEKAEGGPSRGGRITVSTFDSEFCMLTSTSTECESGILDMKVAGQYVAAAQSLSSLNLYTIQEKNSGITDEETDSQHNSFQLEEVSSVSAEDEGLFLSVDWNLSYTFDEVKVSRSICSIDNSMSSEGLGSIVKRNDFDHVGCSNANIAASTQHGSILVYGICSERSFAPIFHASRAHMMMGEPMPVWIVCFDPHSKNTLITGGDDCIMKLWDIRQGTIPTQISKTHRAGVTSAQWHPTQEHVFASGSYDEYLRIWDQRNLRKPVAEIHTGGGVWRTKWGIVGDKSSFLFLSCMQAGSAIVEYDNNCGACELKVKQADKSCENHLAYGIALTDANTHHSQENVPETPLSVPSNVCRGTVIVATCSFYDNLVQVWTSKL